MKQTKVILFTFLLLFNFTSFGQKVKFSDIKTLLSSNQDDKALPLLTKFYNQNIVKGVWSSKAILLEFDNMHSASENIGRIYENKANLGKSNVFADSSIYWYNVMIKDDHLPPQKQNVQKNNPQKPLQTPIYLPLTHTSNKPLQKQNVQKVSFWYHFTTTFYPLFYLNYHFTTSFL